MDPPRQDPLTLQGSASSSSRSPATGRSSDDLPPIWEHLARPETQEEYFDGELRLKMPAKPPHARQHFQLARVLAAHVAEGYLGAVEMLTRTSRGSDFAPDASVYPAAPDPVSGQRQLEELAFEVCSEQSLEVPTFKARELVGRGVRRVFCVVVGGLGQGRRKKLAQSYLLEWSRATDGWSRVPDDAVIKDRCLAPPLPVRGLLDAAAGDDAVAQALVARKNPVVEGVRAEGRAEGLAEGEAARQAAEQARQAAERRAAQLIVSVLQMRGLTLDARARSRILDCDDPRQLERWSEQAFTVGTVEDLWGSR
ncbi:MAG TPA: Uma2 family endonuclease [Thermoanaerobaculia bacterium]|jgi:Uma2 family endonuclease